MTAQSNSIVAYWPRPGSSNVFEGLKNDSLLPRERIVIDYLDRDSCVTNGYVYELLDGSGNTIGWLPHDTVSNDIRLEYTVLSKDSTAPIANIEKIELNKNISLYPNPTSDNQTIEIKGFGSESLSITLYDLQGRKLQDIYKGKVSESELFTINTSHLSSGFYIYSIVQGKERFSLKFIKR